MKIVKLPLENNEHAALTGLSEGTPTGSLLAPGLLVGLSLVLCISLFLRSYTIGLGLPYFYNEDEAHHFNRVVEMVQRGEYNPNYFHKPSLHFYLRMPVVAASFLWTVKSGHIRTVQDIKTRDPQGLSGYSLTASHPGIVKWNRTLSVLFALGVIAGAGLIAYLLTESALLASLSALIAGLSPGLTEYSGVIGVDMPTAFFCTATVVLLLLHLRTLSLSTLLLGCITAGFAVSTKYNALPIAIVPFLASLSTGKLSLPRTMISLILPGVAFFAASPFIIPSLPLFLNHFAYEIWHYGHAAHAGHAATPGVGQALFYGSWLATDGLGLPGFILFLVGTLALLKRPSLAVVTLSFPLIYFGLMISQKTHFERNMLMLLGVLPAIAVYALFRIQQIRIAKRAIPLTLLIVCAATLIPIATASLQARATAIAKAPDSRNEVFAWINQNTPAFTDTALQGELQLPSFQVFENGLRKNSVSGLKRISFADISIPLLIQLGYTRFVVGPDHFEQAQANKLLELIHSVSGKESLDRIPENPAIKVFSLKSDVIRNPIWVLPLLTRADVTIPEIPEDCGTLEQHCWTQARFSRVSSALSGTVEVFSPWGEQEILLFTETDGIVARWSVTQDPVTVSLPPHSGDLFLLTPEVHVPSHYSDSSDTRRLGIAIKPL